MRQRAVQLAPDRPAVALIARPLQDPDQVLPLVAPALPAAPGEVGVYVSEAMVALYGAAPGTELALPLGEAAVRARVLGVWRDYARQFGAVAIADTDYRRLTGDTRVNDLALWLSPGASVVEVQRRLQALLPDPGMLDFAATAELRSLSLRIFDRSFAVTYWLQAVAIAIGLVGIAASLSAQVLARRKEFGLLVHLGLTRAQILRHVLRPRVLLYSGILLAVCAASVVGALLFSRSVVRTATRACPSLLANSLLACPAAGATGSTQRLIAGPRVKFPVGEAATPGAAAGTFIVSTKRSVKTRKRRITCSKPPKTSPPQIACARR